MAVDIRALPTIPEIVTRIVHASSSDSASAADLGSLVESDHAVTSRVLRLANSSLYRRAKQIASVRQAVIVLGFDTIRMLALSVSAFDTVSALEQSSIDLDDFWMHSFGASACAREVLKATGASDDESLAFTGALLHDVGKCLFAASLGNSYGEVVAASAAERTKLRDVELRRFGCHHGHVAQWLCERWSFPTSLTEVVRFCPDYASYAGRYQESVQRAALAEHLSRVVGFGMGGDPVEPAVDVDLARRVGLSEDLLRDLLPRLEQSKSEVASMLQDWKG